MKTKIGTIGIVCLFVIGGFIGVMSFENNSASTGFKWSVETIDSAGDVGTHTSIALDSNGYPHISYRGGTNLKYAKWTGSAWNVETVDSAGVTGDHTSIALDSDDYPHISYIEDTDELHHLTEDLKYARWTGSAWSIETVDSAANVGGGTSIALDSNNYPHISYLDYNNYDLKYAMWNGSAWNTEIVDSVGDVGVFSSIAIDNSDYPHISYHDATNDDLKYAKWTSSAWSIETVDSVGDVGGDSSIALDSNGYPHISYRGGTNLKYAKCTGSAWSIETVDSAGEVGSYTSIALDSNNHPHISYFDYNDYDLKYAIWNGSVWNIETLDSAGDVGYYTSIALDSNDYPHISYHGAGLKYAKGGPTTVPDVPMSLTATYVDSHILLSWNAPSSDGGSPITNYKIYRGTTSGGETLLTTIGNLLSYTDATVSNGMIYYYQVSAVNTIGESPKSNEASATPWIIETVDSEGEVGFATSIALDSNNHPHISYRRNDYPDKNLKYARWTGSVWNVKTVDFASRVIDYTSLALDSNNCPHISYCDWTNEDLKYARWTGAVWNNGSGWSIETVDSTGTVGLSTSIALDSNNYPHISYLDYTNEDLKYARWTGTVWSIETVDSEGEVGFGTSIALDSNDYPHISYVIHADEQHHCIADLKYARWTGSAWSIETVDSSSEVGRESSITLDSNNYPHISYHEYISSPYSDNNLKYAKWTGSAWNIETVDSTGSNVGKGSSIALDSSDNPHISYHGAGDLKYAKWTGITWIMETVDYTGGLGPSTSIALDSNDYPHIGYLGGNDLRYARGGFATAPDTPINLTATAGDTQVSLSWSSPSDDGGFPITNYKIYRGITSGEETLLTTIGNVLTYTNTNLTNGVTYYYQVSAVNAVGEGPLSNEASATPTAGAIIAPDAPTSLTATAGDAQVALSWNAPSSDGDSPITNYKIYRGTTSGDEIPLTTIGNVLTYTDTGLTNNVTYYYKMSAVNVVGEGPLSNEASATPTVGAGEGLRLFGYSALLILAIIVIVVVIIIIAVALIVKMKKRSKYSKEVEEMIEEKEEEI